MAQVDGKRHLLYYVYPLKGPRWEWNLEQLARNVDLFNGRKTIAIAHDFRSETPTVVEKKLDDLGIFADTIWINNDSRIGEVSAWKHLFGSLLSGNSNDVVFYGHAKGVSRAHTEYAPTSIWTDILYGANLDHAPLAFEMLKSHAIVGAFKKIGNGFRGSSSSWHYSGTFFWMRLADAMNKDWRGVEKIWAGVEAWPGVAFKAYDGGCLFHTAPVGTMNLYSSQYVSSIVYPEWRKWIEENKRWKRERFSITLPMAHCG